MNEVDTLARRYIVRKCAVDCGFEAVAEPLLPDGTGRAERPTYEAALALARLWRLQHGGKVIEGRRR